MSNTRRRLVGEVVAARMQKTVTVRVDRSFRHPVYEKVLRRSRQYLAHDELGVRPGDLVRIVGGRPFSQSVHWAGGGRGMIQQEPRRKIADNPGGRELLVIRVLGGSRRRYGRVGDIVVGSVKSAVPHGAVHKSEVVRAVIVRLAKEYRRETGPAIPVGTQPPGP